MIKKLIGWVTTHKLTSIVALVIGYFLLQWFLRTSFFYDLSYRLGSNSPSSSYYGGANVGGAMPATSTYEKSMVYEQNSAQGMAYDTTQPPSSLAVDVKNRMVTKNYNLSLLGKDIKTTAESIASETEKLGGFVVSNSINNYQDTESAYLTVRIPANKVKPFLTSVKGLAIKTVSESENGSDITSEYTDIQENIRLLENTKTRFEEIWKASTKTQDMLSVLREIQYLQREIDSLKGQEKYLKEISQYSLFSINISKDEMDLPYMPSESWSAEFIFRSAIRDLVRTFRSVATKAIWLGVFAVVWLPILLVTVFVFKKYKKQIIG